MSDGSDGKIKSLFEGVDLQWTLRFGVLDAQHAMQLLLGINKLT